MFIISYWYRFLVPHFWGGVAAAVGSIAGGLIGSKGQKDANSASAQSVQAQMDFQERMSNTGYQRAVKDLAKAGLNPMLAYSQGPASTPSGASYTAQNEQAPLANAVSNSAAKVATIQNIRAQTEKAEAEANLASAQAAESAARVPTYESTIAVNQATIRKIDSEIPKILADTNVSVSTATKIAAEIANLSKTGELITAQTVHSLASGELTRAQIAEVVPRINNLIANTRRTHGEAGLSEFKGQIGEDLRAARQSVSSSKDAWNQKVGRAIGSKAFDAVSGTSNMWSRIKGAFSDEARNARRNK